MGRGAGGSGGRRRDEAADTVRARRSFWPRRPPRGSTASRPRTRPNCKAVLLPNPPPARQPPGPVFRGPWSGSEGRTDRVAGDVNTALVALPAAAMTARRRRGGAQQGWGAHQQVRSRGSPCTGSAARAAGRGCATPHEEPASRSTSGRERGWGQPVPTVCCPDSCAMHAPDKPAAPAQWHNKGGLLDFPVKFLNSMPAVDEGRELDEGHARGMTRAHA